MDKRFDHIDINNEKVKLITATAFEVFSKNDIKKASTNLIVQKAGISRGILYHYFKDKQELFDFLIYFAFKSTTQDINTTIDWEDNDVINRICKATIHRLDIMSLFPYMHEFFEKYLSHAVEYMEQLDLSELRQKFYHHNVDYTLFEDHDTIDQSMKIIKWTFRGLAREILIYYVKERDDSILENAKRDCETYSEVLKRRFYKQV